MSLLNKSFKSQIIPGVSAGLVTGVADEPSIIYLLSAKKMAKMENKSPEVASFSIS